MKLEEIRKKYPQYESLSDGDLAYRLWDKSYRNAMPMGQFADTIGLPQDGFRQMIDVARSSGYEPTSRSFAEGNKPPLSGIRSFTQGATLGAADEIVGALRGAGQKIGGAEQPLSNLISQATEDERAALEQYRQVSPIAAGATELAGSIASPANLISGAGIANPIARAAATGGATGAAYGFMSGEGGAKERAENAIPVAISSALIGAGTQAALSLTGNAGRRIARAFDKSQQTPTLDNLRSAKNVAYEAVDASGVKFSQQDMRGLFSQAMHDAADLDYVPEVDRETFAALKVLNNQRNKELTIGQLDKVRQNLWRRFNATQGKEPAIGAMIDSIDNLIASHPATDDLMSAARLANSRYKKAELLTNAFDRADLQTASTGSGGNVLNKYRQAVTSILNNPKQAKWFSPDEVQSMENFVKGNVAENAMRLIGKLSPTGNGLMAALNVGAVAMNPAMLGVSAAGIASKAAADMSTQAGAESLIRQLSTGTRPQPIPYLPGLGGAAASTAAQGLASYQQE